MEGNGLLDAPHPSQLRDRRLVRFAFLLGIILLVIIVGYGCVRLPNRGEDPLSAKEHFTLASIYEGKGERELALREYKIALEKDANFLQAMTRLAELSYIMGQYGQAERYYQKAIKLAPRDGDLYNNLCWVYLSQEKKLKRAESLIMKAMELNPKHKGYYFDTLGTIYLQERRYREAIKVLEVAASFFDETKPDLLGQVYRHLGLAYNGIGEWSKAEQAFKKAVDVLGR
jgi:tetratricopeptide (TPR) repeat protein